MQFITRSLVLTCNHISRCWFSFMLGLFMQVIVLVQMFLQAVLGLQVISHAPYLASSPVHRTTHPTNGIC